MKRFIVLGTALMLLLFGFAANVEVAQVANGILLCDDLEPQINPYDGPSI